MKKPWDSLDEYRGSHFQGDWPTVPEMFRIKTERHPDRGCFRAFEPAPVAFTYKEALRRIEMIAAHLISSGTRKGDRVEIT